MAAVGTEKGGWPTRPKRRTIYRQLAVDMYDSKNRDLVWRGITSETIDPKAKPEKQEKNLVEAVSKLFARGQIGSERELLG
jgi:hypothetical protein